MLILPHPARITTLYALRTAVTRFLRIAHGLKTTKTLMSPCVTAGLSTGDPVLVHSFPLTVWAPGHAAASKVSQQVATPLC